MKRLLALLLLLAPTALAADLTGRFEPNTKYEPPASHAPANVSRMFARDVPRIAAHASVELPASGGSGMIIWTPERGARLTTPTGAILQPTDRGSLERGLRRFRTEGTEEVLHVTRTMAASYRLDVDVPDDASGVTVLAAEPDSPITLSTWAAPLSRQPGEPVTLRAELRDGDAAIAGAKVVARLISPRGRTFDVVPLSELADGVYGATVSDLPEHAAGAWQVRFEAEGATPNGVRFARTGAGELVAERGAARLGNPRAEVVGDVLRVSVPATVALSGKYRFDVIAGRDGASLAWAEGPRELEVGATTLSIDLPLANVGRAGKLFLDVRLLGLDAIGVAGRVAVEVP
jgi:hypothetical protein